MKMKNKYNDFRTGFIDLLLCSFASVVVLFILSTLLINPAKKVVNEGIRKDAEYVIELNWNPDVDCDVDLWMRDPDKNIVSFLRKDIALMHLERDDLGSLNDTYINNNSTFKSMHNNEVVTIRGIIPGEYTVNIHLYACRVNKISLPVGAAIEIPTIVKVTKLNPNLTVMVEKETTFSHVWQEITIVNMKINSNGYIEDKDESPVRLVTATRGK